MNEQPAAPRPNRPPPRLVSVERVERLTPHMLRVRLTGESLAGYTMASGPASHIKVVLPQDGDDRPFIPDYGPDGPILAEGQKRPLSRTYTPRRWHPEAQALDVDFLLHGDGPAASWAKSAQPGSLVAVTNPGGPYNLDASATSFVIAGDDSALPAIGTILEALPASARASVLIEVEDSTDEMELESRAQIDVTWLHRGDSEDPIGALLASTLRQAKLPAAEAGRIWVGCEAEIMRDLRRWLVFERGWDRKAIHTHGYWKLGASNHPDHDVGQEI
ncbi:MAG: siderophore-interacting protein [Dehalococcoidia bacterium]|nr:siderophore-interacting protein [Dehalococcoidia bacterium]